jgi:hypothetical protein
MADNAQGPNWPQDAGASTYSAPAAPKNPYLEQLKGSLSADAYQKLMSVLQYGGESDIGAQIFTPLSKDVIKDVPKSVQPTYDTTEGGDQVAQGQSVHVGETNGIPVYANYDEKGQLTGFSGDQTRRAWVNGNQSYGGQWDASGNANPQQYNSKGGGFFGNLASDIGGGLSDLYMAVRDPLEAAAVVGGNYFLPGSGLLTSQLVSDKAKENLSSDLGKVAMIGSGIAGGVNGNMSNYGSIGESLGLTGEPSPVYDYGPPPESPVYDYGPPPENPVYDYGPPPENPVYDYGPPPASPSLLDKALDFASANPLTTAGGIAALAGASGAIGGNKTDTPAAPASTPQTYNLKPFDFQRNYNTPEALTKDYTQGQNTGERNWVTDTLTALPEKTIPAKARGGSISSHEAYMHPQNIAQHLAAQGRHGDDMLVHMNRNEVAGLQSLAQQKGTSLTRNPHTGLPEAFGLGDLNPVRMLEGKSELSPVAAPLLGAGLNMMVPGLGALGAAGVVGGVSALASGNLGKGLMAGLGAYGGASIGAGLADMGANELAGTPSSYNAVNGADLASDQAMGAGPSMADKLGAGASYAANNPQAALAQLGNGSMWKGAGYLGAAAAPFLADKMVQTSTPAPVNQNPALIRPFTFQHNAVAPSNMVQPSYQPGQSTAERRWFEDTLTPYPSYPASEAKAPRTYADGGDVYAMAGGGLGSLGGYSDGGRLLKGPGDGVSDSIPATIGQGRKPARLADGEFVVPARIVSELGNGSTEAGAKQLYKMMDRIQAARRKTTGKHQVAANSNAASKLPA